MTTDPLLLNTLNKIDATGQITHADQIVLTAMLMAKSTVAPDDNCKIQHIYDRLTRGAIQLVD